MSFQYNEFISIPDSFGEEHKLSFVDGIWSKHQAGLGYDLLIWTDTDLVWRCSFMNEYTKVISSWILTDLFTVKSLKFMDNPPEVYNPKEIKSPALCTCNIISLWNYGHDNNCVEKKRM